MTDNTWPTVDTELIDDVTLYSAKLIIPVTGPVIIDGAVAIHGDRVVHVGKRRWVLKALKQEMTAHGTIHERHWDGVLTPGLINAHTHLQYSGMVQVGQGTYDRFRAWELAFNEVYAEAQKTQPWKQWAEDGARQMVESGTTAAADIVTDLDAAGALASQASARQGLSPSSRFAASSARIMPIVPRAAADRARSSGMSFLARSGRNQSTARR